MNKVSISRNKREGRYAGTRKCWIGKYADRHCGKRRHVRAGVKGWRYALVRGQS